MSKGKKYHATFKLTPCKTRNPDMTPSVKHGSTVGKIPPLESGDRLTRFEFERRYMAMPHIRKAELIEGVVYVA
jgi:hypothetical protein